MLVWEFTKRNIPNNDKIEESHIYTILPLCQYAIIGNSQIYNYTTIKPIDSTRIGGTKFKSITLLIFLVLISARIC